MGIRRKSSVTKIIISQQHTIHTHQIFFSPIPAKNFSATLLFVDFSEAFDSIHRMKMEQILQT